VAKHRPSVVERVTATLTAAPTTNGCARDGQGIPEESLRCLRELAAIADDVEAGRIDLPPRWKFTRVSRRVQVWTIPSGRNFACDPAGNLLPLPDGWEWIS
jgi:hypothetical protein